MPFHRFFIPILLCLTSPSWAAVAIQLPAQTPTSLGNADTLQLMKAHQGPDGTYHTRLQQYYDDVPIDGAVAILHSTTPVDKAKLLSARAPLTGVVYTKLAQDLGQKPDYTKAIPDALALVKAEYLATAIQREQTQAMIYLSPNHQAHWAIQVCLWINASDKRPSIPCTILDAVTKQPYRAWNNLQTHAIQAQGFGGNPVMGEHQYGQDLPLLSIQRNSRQARCTMENKAIRVVDLQHDQHSAISPAMSFPCELRPSGALYWTGHLQDGYDKVNEALSPSNDAFYAADMVKQMYMDWYHVPPLSNADGMPQKLIMRVHFGVDYDNAYWDGTSMTFGDGDNTLFYPLVSLGITAHEISHGFTQQHANLRYYDQSGAMNEAFSDMADKAAEYYAGQKTDWRIGAEVLKPQSGLSAFRYMDNPSLDGNSVNSVSDYLIANQASFDTYGEGLDVHHGSGVYNRLFYLLATRPQWDIKQAFDVMVYANMDYWTPRTDFQEGGCGILHAAKDLHRPLEDVEVVLTQVGIDPKACVGPNTR